ncbi:hypothetical protein GCM10023093_03220 [Nemorincola caseinilytica]|uniref:Photosynthesis system II assembly factor Ycf48/Hcf136-like domain-containing protein n=1 Tax=Nemorincola caseinilytica TaxID=2054315 RepID=A0ABP8N341_9BACT
MNRFWILGIMVLFAAGCKKDQLRTDNVYSLASNTTDRLNKVRFISDKECFVAGGELYDRATVLHSTDGGYTWTAGSYPAAGKGLYGFAVSPAGAMYMCGTDGVVLHSRDTGRNWLLGRILNWNYYIAAAYPVEDTGIFISTVLQRASAIVQVDTAFNIISQDTFQFGLNNIYMTGPSTGYAIGYGVVLKTTDHRRTWAYQDVEGDNFTAMSILGNEIWMCGANGSIFHTTDGGAHWQRLRNGNSLSIPRYMLRDILFTDLLHGWAVGDEGLIICTEDGGRNWREYERFTSYALRSITLCPNGDMLVVGDKGGIYRIVR